MKYKGVEFEAIVATPGCGKSYLCDKYPEKYVDVDELRLRCKYVVPDNITRQELESTKGNRQFPKREGGKENYLKLLREELVKTWKAKKVLICAPHPEVIDWLKEYGIKYCFIYQSLDMIEEMRERFISRGNSDDFVKENCDAIEKFYDENVNETNSAVKYEFGHGEYLEDILKKFE